MIVCACVCAAVEQQYSKIQIIMHTFGVTLKINAISLWVKIKMMVASCHWPFTKLAATLNGYAFEIVLIRMYYNYNNMLGNAILFHSAFQQQLE